MSVAFEEYVLVLHPTDDVGVVRHAAGMPAGMELRKGSVHLTANGPIAAGHKIALRAIGHGEPVRKYGQVIGYAERDIAAGDHVHTHNLGIGNGHHGIGCHGGLAPPCLDVEKQNTAGPAGHGTRREFVDRTFDGYLRSDGRVGTRNYVAIISTVNCSAGVSDYVRDRFRTPEFRRDFPHVDGVVAFTHKTGCGMQTTEPMRLLQRVMAGMARHPNIAGYIMIGLGCETNQIQLVRDAFGLNVLPAGGASADAKRPAAFMTIQEQGGVAKTVDAATAAVAKLLPIANEARRTKQSARHLTLALNCGGSDGYSGITANPALGVASDLLVAHGGASVLAETPEIYGAEHLLLRRAASPHIAAELTALVKWWEDHAARHEASIDNNPSYGNKEGGLTTIYEKSLGAIAKGGQAPLTAVYRYAEPIAPHAGFVFMDTPGFDPVSMTGLVAGGCNIACFTTGRGSVYGCKPTPSIKIATTTRLFERMPDDMDLNAGPILDGTESVEQVGHRIFEKILTVASGEQTKSEAQGLGDEEFAPWQLGPTL